MKNRLLPSLSLLVLLLASCAPAAAATQPPLEQPAAPAAPEPTPTAFTPPDSANVPTDAVVVPTEAAAPLPVATSRGPELHATNPSTVSLASGGLQFVEFFRFT